MMSTIFAENLITIYAFADVHQCSRQFDGIFFWIPETEIIFWFPNNYFLELVSRNFLNLKKIFNFNYIDPGFFQRNSKSGFVFLNFEIIYISLRLTFFFF